MIIPHHIALQIFEANIARNYVLYSDLLAHLKNEDTERLYIANDEQALTAGSLVVYTAYQDHTVIETHGSANRIDEALAYAETKDKPTFIVADTATATLLQKRYTLTEASGTGYDHHGIYGCTNATTALPSSDVAVGHITPEDASRIAALPTAEWGNLPILIRFAKNTDRIFLAQISDMPAGYLIYASSHEMYYDIVNVFVHPSKRLCGVGKALVNAFISAALKDGRLPYYGEAKTEASAVLAASMGFEKLSSAKAVYTLQK